MTVYVIGQLRTKRWDWYNEYRSKVEPLIAKHGGRYIVKGGAPAGLEGGEESPDAVVVVAFPDRESVQNWYNDPEYAPMIALRQDAGVLTALVVADAMPER